MASEQELIAAAKKAPAQRTDQEQAWLGAGQLPLNVRNELSSTERRVRIYGS